MNPVNNKEVSCVSCCLPKKKPLLKRNYANIVKMDIMDGIDPKKEKEIFDIYLSRIESQTYGL